MNTIIYNKSVSQSKFKEIIAWCHEYMGPGPIIHNHVNAELHRWCYDTSMGIIKIIYIKDDLDFMLFHLRWG
jgi:hypothetical protein